MSRGWRRSDLPPNWHLLRRERFELDNWTCADCGLHDPTGKALEGDHIGDHDDHRIEALRTRCRRCHKLRSIKQLADLRRQRAAARLRPLEPHPGRQADPGG